MTWFTIIATHPTEGTMPFQTLPAETAEEAVTKADLEFGSDDITVSARPATEAETPEYTEADEAAWYAAHA